MHGLVDTQRFIVKRLYNYSVSVKLKPEASMFKWLINGLTDILIALLVSTLILAYSASHYPDYFPAKFYHYWPIKLQTPPKSAPTSQMQVNA
jgi:hypothetical protein